MLKRRLISSTSAIVAAIVLSSLLAFGQGQPPQPTSPKSKATAKRKQTKQPTTPPQQPPQLALPQQPAPPAQPQPEQPQTPQPQAPQSPPDQQAQPTPPANAATATVTPITAVAPASTKRPSLIRIGVVAPITPLKQGGPGNEFSEAIRQSLAAYFSSPVSETVSLEARVPVLAELEARQKECDFILYSTVTERQRSNDLAKLMTVAAPVVNLAASQGSASNKAAPGKSSATGTGEPGAATAAAPTTTETAPAATSAPAATEKAAPINTEKALKAATDLSNRMTAGNELVFEFKLVEPGAEKPKLARALKAKVEKDGADALSPLLAQAANDVLQATIKK